MIWSDAFLDQLGTDAEQQINQDLQAIYFKFCLPVTLGVSVYKLPSYLRSIDRITWRGKALDPVNWDELLMLSPATVGGFVETSLSRPLYYCMHPTDTYAVRFYPTPDESFTDTGDTPYSPTVNAPACIISCWRTTDDTFLDPKLLLPPYIDRRTRKAYVLWKAFAAEGKGQDLRASAYYKKKYDFLIEQFKSINDGCYVGQKYAIEEGELTIDQWRYPKPVLPTNYERIIYD
jgi:hypothetical protein